MDSVFGNIIPFFISAVAIIVIFSVVILIHEIGHFAAAKFFKVKVEEFGMGLPPKALRVFKKGDTEYTLNWIPFGGFVRMLGESDTTGELAGDQGSFSSKPVWQRMIITCAGVIMNFILAFVLLLFLFITGYDRPLYIFSDEKYPFAEESLILMKESDALKRGIIVLPKHPLEIYMVAPGSQAEKIGISSGSTVINVNGNPITSEEKFLTLLNNIGVGSGMTMEVALKNGTQQVFSFTKESKLLGITLTKAPFLYNENPISYPPLEATYLAGRELKNQTEYTFIALGEMFGKILTSMKLPEELGGPVQIASTINTATKFGIDALVFLTIIISINLGVFNILPIPALDGGRMVFLCYEGIFRRKPHQGFEIRIHIIGYVLLLLLILAVTYQDIMRLIFK